MNKRLTSLFAAAVLITGAPTPAAAQHTSRQLRTAEYRALQTKLCSGWNTWSANSVLAHVYLPDGFALTLGFKSAGMGHAYQNTFFQANETARRPEKIRLGPHADDGSYTDLTVEWNTGGAGTKNAAQVQSATENGEEYILINVQQHAPLRVEHLIVETGYYWNRPGTVRRDGAVLRAQPGREGGHPFEVRTTSHEVNDPFVTVNAPYLSVALEGRIAVYTGPEKTLEQVAAIVEEHHAAHMKRLADFGADREVFTAMQTILGWNLTYDPENDRAISPVSRNWSSYWGGYVLFDWDTYFASFMYSLYNQDLAFANAIEVTKGITRGGFIPNCASAYGIQSDDRSQPPVGSLMVLEIYKRHKEKWFLAEVYDELLRWNRWWPGARDTNGLLAWGSDNQPQLVDGNFHNAPAAVLESGLDNSPMYDGVPFNPQTNQLEMADVGLNALYVADCRALAEIAGVLGKTADQRELLARGDKYAAALGTLWDETSGIYLNKRTDTGERSSKLSPTNFYPLIAKVATPEQAVRMVKEHYFNPREFYGEWVIPAIARNVPGFQDQDYWRGRIWGPMNFLVYLGMRNYDLGPARTDLADRSRKLLMKSWQSDRSVYENYNSITGAGNDVRSSDAYYHWGALLGVIGLMEQGY
ncbi:MAG: trehalase family glycosidase [Bryobacteraceae bacterium]